MKRPLGITLIALLALVSGLFGLCWPTLILTGSLFLGPFLGTIGIFAGIFLIVGPIFQLVFAVGALNMSPWSWYLGLIGSGITLFGVVVNLIDGGTIQTAVSGSVLSIIIFIYLLTPNVRQVFGQLDEPHKASSDSKADT